MNEKNILKLCYTSSDAWVLPIWTAFNKAEKRGRIKRSRSFQTGKDGIYITTKLNFLRIIYDRIDQSNKEIIETIKNSEYNTKFCFDGISKKDTFSILLDIETYFREAYSIIEFVEKFTRKLFVYICDSNKNDSDKFLNSLQYQKENWYQAIREYRHSFTHHRSPWISICTSPYELVVESKQCKSRQLNNYCLTTSQMIKIDSEFRKFLYKAQKELIGYFDNL